MDALLHLDRALVETAPAFENGLLTALFLLLSAWWVKGPLLVGLGLCSDIWRRRLPLAFAAAAAAAGAASLVDSRPQGGLRPRAPAGRRCGTRVAGLDPGQPVVPVRSQRHGLRGRNRRRDREPAAAWPALAIAAAVALSRVYLRVHFPLDVVAGALLGAGLGALCAVVMLRLARAALPARAAA